MHPALMSALYGLARHEECTLEQLVVKLIHDGLTIRLKLGEMRVLERVVHGQGQGPLLSAGDQAAEGLLRSQEGG
jgi:hypothetical protein